MVATEKQKNLALDALRTLDIYKPYVNKFNKSGTVTMFEQFAGFYIDENTDGGELYKKIQEVQEKYGYLVYAVTHEMTNIGEMYDLLVIPKEDNEDMVQEYGNNHLVFAYVWNKTDDMMSEAGDIVVQSFGGGIRRIK